MGRSVSNQILKMEQRPSVENNPFNITEDFFANDIATLKLRHIGDDTDDNPFLACTQPEPKQSKAVDA